MKKFPKTLVIHTLYEYKPETPNPELLQKCIEVHCLSTNIARVIHRVCTSRSKELTEFVVPTSAGVALPC